MYTPTQPYWILNKGTYSINTLDKVKAIVKNVNLERHCLFMAKLAFTSPATLSPSLPVFVFVGSATGTLFLIFAVMKCLQDLQTRRSFLKWGYSARGALTGPQMGLFRRYLGFFDHTAWRGTESAIWPRYCYDWTNSNFAQTLDDISLYAEGDY